MKRSDNELQGEGITECEGHGRGMRPAYLAVSDESDVIRRTRKVPFFRIRLEGRGGEGAFARTELLTRRTSAFSETCLIPSIHPTFIIQRTALTDRRAEAETFSVDAVDVDSVVEICAAERFSFPTDEWRLDHSIVHAKICHY